jgi:hypothetical protein
LITTIIITVEFHLIGRTKHSKKINATFRKKGANPLEKGANPSEKYNTLELS